MVFLQDQKTWIRDASHLYKKVQKSSGLKPILFRKLLPNVCEEA